ncbi:MAG: OmpA family protein [bacterium]
MTHDQKTANLWMIPYADLMSCLVILFAAVFGYSYNLKEANFEKAMAVMQHDLGQKDAGKKLNEADAAKIMETRLKEEIILGKLGMEITTTKMNLVFSSPVLFASGSADLKPEADAILKTVAEGLKDLDNPVIVDGHTDSLKLIKSRHKTNRELSAARAFSVIDFLTKQGVAPDRLTALGYGEYRPVADNATEEGRRKNRRIEITVLRD